MSIKVFTADVALAAAKADITKVLSIEKKKNSKAYRGTEFLNAYWTFGADVKKEGWFSFENVELTDGIADPANKEDRRNEFEGTRLQLQTTLSRAGQIGEFLSLLNPQWRKQVEDLGSSNVIDLDGRKIHDLLQLTLSKKNENNPGGKIDDPIIRFQIDFATFPQKYPHAFLRGLPRTQFYDARTEYKDEQGRVQYKLATITKDDGTEEPITEKNVHLFVTKGSKIVKGRLMMPSVPVSQSWVSLPMVANRIVLMPGTGGGFTDDDFGPNDIATIKSALTTQLSPAAPATSTADAEPPSPDEIGDVLANI